MPASAATVGTNPLATATQGVAPAGQRWPVDPAVLMPILQMLLDD